MSFWDLSDGASATTNAIDHEVANNKFEVIPDGSRVLALIDSIAWKTNENGNEERIAIKWVIHEPREYENRKISQSLWVTDDNPQKTGDGIDKKRNLDKQKLAKLDAICGDKLGARARKPTDDELTLALSGKMMVIELGVMESERGDFNWVRNTYRKGAKSVNIADAPAASHKPKQEARATKKVEPETSLSDDLDDDIPF